MQIKKDRRADQAAERVNDFETPFGHEISERAGLIEDFGLHLICNYLAQSYARKAWPFRSRDGCLTSHWHGGTAREFGLRPASYEHSGAGDPYCTVLL